MAEPATTSLVSPEEYLAGEECAETRHEYVAGAVYAMAGGRNQHNAVKGNVFATFHAQLRGKPCRPFDSDTKVRLRLPDQIRFYYPDALITCQPNPAGDTFQDNPIIVVEVLSASTRRTDEGEKREGYLALPSLEAYLLVESERPLVVCWRRRAAGFVREVYEGLGAEVPLPEAGVVLRLADVYEGTSGREEPVLPQGTAVSGGLPRLLLEEPRPSDARSPPRVPPRASCGTRPVRSRSRRCEPSVSPSHRGWGAARARASSPRRDAGRGEAVRRVCGALTAAAARRRPAPLSEAASCPQLAPSTSLRCSRQETVFAWQTYECPHARKLARTPSRSRCSFWLARVEATCWRARGHHRVFSTVATPGCATAPCVSAANDLGAATDGDKPSLLTLVSGGPGRTELLFNVSAGPGVGMFHGSYVAGGGSGYWSALNNVAQGESLHSPVAALNPSTNRFYVVATGRDGRLWVRSRSNNAVGWTGWQYALPESQAPGSATNHYVGAPAVAVQRGGATMTIAGRWISAKAPVLSLMTQNNAGAWLAYLNARRARSRRLCARGVPPPYERRDRRSAPRRPELPRALLLRVRVPVYDLRNVRVRGL